MQDQVFTFLSGLPSFARLPAAELKKISEAVTAKTFQSGHNLAVQTGAHLHHQRGVA